jgi:hypothetical protein
MGDGDGGGQRQWRRRCIGRRDSSAITMRGIEIVVDDGSSNGMGKNGSIA